MINLKLCGITLCTMLVVALHGSDQGNKKNQDYLANGAKAFFARQINGQNATVNTKSEEHNNQSSNKQNTAKNNPSSTEVGQTLQQKILNALSDEQWEDWEKNGGELSFKITFPDPNTTK